MAELFQCAEAVACKLTARRDAVCGSEPRSVSGMDAVLRGSTQVAQRRQVCRLGRSHRHCGARLRSDRDTCPVTHAGARLWFRH